MRLHITDLGWVELRYVIWFRRVPEDSTHIYLRKFLLPIVYNGLSATIFCVTRKIVHIATTYIRYSNRVCSCLCGLTVVRSGFRDTGAVNHPCICVLTGCINSHKFIVGFYSNLL